MAESENNKVSRPQKGRWWKILLWSVLGLWAVLLLGIQVALNSKVLKRIATSLANEYVEGDVDFSSIKASVFKSFPNLNVSIDGFVLTYPHERFAAFDSLIPSRDSLHRSGWHLPTSDTLASFSRLSASVNYMEALKKKIRIPHVVLEHPRIFLHRYDSLTGTFRAFCDVALTNSYFWNGWGDSNYSEYTLRHINDPKAPRLTYNKVNNNFQASDRWLADGSFFKIQSIELGYNIPVGKGSFSHVVRGLRVYARANNLLTLSGIEDVDPEALGSGLTNYPLMKTFTGGLKMTF